MRAENTPVPQTRGGTCRGAETFAATFASVTRSIPWAHLDRVCSGPPVSCSRAPRHTSLPTFCVPCTTSRWLPSRRRACRRSRRGSMPIARSASTARGGRLASCDRSRCPRALGARARDGAVSALESPQGAKLAVFAGRARSGSRLPALLAPSRRRRSTVPSSTADGTAAAPTPDDSASSSAPPSAPSPAASSRDRPWTARSHSRGRELPFQAWRGGLPGRVHDRPRERRRSWQPDGMGSRRAVTGVVPDAHRRCE